MSSTSHIIRRGQVDGTFEGFDSDSLFKLADGTYWLQAEYSYWYYYAYRPVVEIYSLNGVPHLRVVGQSQSVAVPQISDVIESRIAGEFTGWDGESEYELINGQIWKQTAYRYEYKYKYRPRVLIYGASAGKMMDVEGSRAVVERIR